MVAPYVIPAVLSAGSTVAGLLGKKKVKQPPEYRAALGALTNFFQTGKFGNFTAGEAYSGPLGDFDPTDIESESLGRLGSFVQSSTPEIFSTGTQALGELINGDRFDPHSATGEYGAFKQDVENQLAEGATRLKRNAAFSGNLYSSDTVNNLGELEQEGQRQLTGKLGELYDRYVTRKTAAIPMAFDAANQEQALALRPIEAGMQYGGLTRELNTQDAQSRLAQYLRQRQELMLPIQAAGSIVGSNIGPSSVSMPGEFSGVLNQIGQTSIQELIRQLYAK